MMHFTRHLHERSCSRECFHSLHICIVLCKKDHSCDMSGWPSFLRHDPLQPHLTSSSTACGAGLSRHLTSSSFPYTFCSHPLSFGWGRIGLGYLYYLSRLKMILAVCVAMRVLCVGGSFTPWKVSHELLLEYALQTNLYTCLRSD